MTHTTGIEIAVAAVIAIILIVVIALVQLRKSKNVYGRLWAPLIPLVNGTAQSNRLSGTYDGMPISARIAGEGEHDPTYHYELTVTPGVSAGDWALSYTGEKFLGTGTKTWRVKSKNDELRMRLTDAGAVNAIQEWNGQPEITYKSRSGTLHYWQPVNGMYDVPPIEEFKAQLDLLSRLAKINRQTNIT